MTIADSQAFVFDLDGVVWLGNTPIDGITTTLSLLRSSGKKIRFFTNNASLHRDDFVRKLNSMGVEASKKEVLSSGYAACYYLNQHFSNANIHVLGSDGLKQEITEAGHRLVDRGAQAVVVGYDRRFNWEKLDLAFQNIYEDKAKFIACNLDKKYVEENCYRPGTGATVAALSYCLEMQPEVVAGKPNQAMIDALRESLGLELSKAVIIGDKLYTDIACGIKAGMKTILVRSGNGAEEEAKIDNETKPDMVIDSVADIPNLF